MSGANKYPLNDLTGTDSSICCFLSLFVGTPSIHFLFMTQGWTWSKQLINSPYNIIPNNTEFLAACVMEQTCTWKNMSVLWTIDMAHKSWKSLTSLFKPFFFELSHVKGQFPALDSLSQVDSAWFSNFAWRFVQSRDFFGYFSWAALLLLCFLVRDLHFCPWFVVETHTRRW